MRGGCLPWGLDKTGFWREIYMFTLMGLAEFWQLSAGLGVAYGNVRGFTCERDNLGSFAYRIYMSGVSAGHAKG